MSDAVAMKVIAAQEAAARVKLMDIQAQALQKTADATRKMVDSNAARNSNEMRINVLNTVGRVLTTLGKPLGFIAKDASPYIVLILIFVIIFGGLYATSRGGNNLSSVSRQRDKIFHDARGVGGSISRMLRQMLSFFTPSHRMKLLLRSLNPFAGYPSTTPRPTVGAGRCDDLVWREVGADGASGVCGVTYKPKDITWTLDISELDRLPAKLKQELTAGGQRLQVNIPWASQGTFYVPQCSRATFNDGTSAAYLFTDTGLACKIRELPAKRYTPAHRPKDAKKLDDYATAADPKC